MWCAAAAGLRRGVVGAVCRGRAAAGGWAPRLASFIAATLAAAATAFDNTTLAFVTLVAAALTAAALAVLATLTTLAFAALSALALRPGCPPTSPPLPHRDTKKNANVSMSNGGHQGHTKKNIVCSFD